MLLAIWTNTWVHCSRLMAGSPSKNPVEVLKEDLRELEPSAFAMYYLFDKVPAIFKDSDQCTQWKIKLADALGVDAHSVVVIGSGCTGFSLHPLKNFKKFGPASDVDVAVISSIHFEIAWRYIRDVGASIYNLPQGAQNAIEAHRAEHVFWGTIATDKILPHIEPFGPKWVKELSAIENAPPIDGKPLKIRIYRDSYSLVGYHVNNIRKLRKELLSTTR